MNLYKSQPINPFSLFTLDTRSIPPRLASPRIRVWKITLFNSSQLALLALHSANMHLSTGNIIGILSLMVAVPCTAIMVWKVIRRQQRDAHDTRRFSTVLNFVDPVSNRFKMTELCCHYFDNLVGGLQAAYRVSAYSLVLASKLE